MKLLASVSCILVGLAICGMAASQAGEKSDNKDMESLQGTWRGVKGPGSPESDERAKNIKYVVKGNKMTVIDSNPDQKTTTEGTVKLDPKTKAFDWEFIQGEKKGSWSGIYELKGDDFKFYVVPRIVGVPELPRPKSFDDKPRFEGKPIDVQLF